MPEKQNKNKPNSIWAVMLLRPILESQPAYLLLAPADLSWSVVIFWSKKKPSL